MRARDAFSSSSRARSSAWSRSFSSAKAAAAQTACDELLVLLEARVDDQRGHGTTVRLDQPHRSRDAVRRQLDGPAARIDVAGFLGEPVREPEVGVVQRACQRFPYLIGAASVLELHDERGNAGPRKALPQEPREEGERDDRERCGPDDAEVSERGAERLVDERQRADGDGRSTGPEHRSDHPAHGRARSPPAVNQERHCEEREECAEGPGCIRQRDVHLLVGAEQDRVRGAAVLAHVRVEEESREPYHRRVDVRGDHDRARQS